MGAGEVSESPDKSDRVEASTDRIMQATSVAVVAAAPVVWWPGFDFGGVGGLFFNQFFALWAASTAICLASLTAGRRARVSWARRLALLIPSLWLLLAFALPEG